MAFNNTHAVISIDIFQCCKAFNIFKALSSTSLIAKFDRNRNFGYDIISDI